jgi:hypothetical protein
MVYRYTSKGTLIFPVTIKVYNSTEDLSISIKVDVLGKTGLTPLRTLQD